MSKMQRNKGARGERELAKLLEDQLGIEVTRNLVQSRDGGHDLEGLPVALEVKRQEALRLAEWWFQAVIQATRAGKLPALAWRQNGKPWTFRVPITFFSGPCRAEYLTEDIDTFTADIGIDTFCLVVRELWL